MNKFMKLTEDYEGLELLRDIYEELKSYKEISSETKKFVVLFFEDKKKFVNDRRRELRRQAGCRTYFDEKGLVRLVSSGKLENSDDLLSLGPTEEEDED